MCLSYCKAATARNPQMIPPKAATFVSCVPRSLGTRRRNRGPSETTALGSSSSKSCHWCHRTESSRNNEGIQNIPGYHAVSSSLIIRIRQLLREVQDWKSAGLQRKRIEKLSVQEALVDNPVYHVPQTEARSTQSQHVCCEFPLRDGVTLCWAPLAVSQRG